MNAAREILIRALEAKRQQLPSDEVAIHLQQLQAAIDALAWPANYLPTLPWRSRFLRVLEHLQTAYVTDIVSIILSKQPELDKQKTHYLITRMASDLHVAGRIVAKKEATRNLYSMPSIVKS